MTKPHLRVKYVLVCDDLRTEDNGKQILIGVYTGGIVFPSFPARALLTVWCDIEQPETGTIPLRLRAEYGAEQKEVFGATLDMEVQQSGAGNFAFKFPLRADAPGTLRILLRQHDDDWQELKTVEVTKGPTTSSAALRPT